MDTIAKRLDKAMNNAGFKSQMALSRASGVPQPTISRILGEDGIPDTLTLQKLAKACNVSFEWLANNAGEPFQSIFDEQVSIKKDASYAPVVGIAMGGADGYLSIDDYPVGEGSHFVPSYSQDKNAYALRVRGDSMRPRIKSGEFVVVEPNIAAQPGDDVVVKLTDGRALVKELQWVRDGDASFGSINNGIPPMTIPLSEIDKIHRISAIVPRGSALIKGSEDF